MPTATDSATALRPTLGAAQSSARAGTVSKRTLAMPQLASFLPEVAEICLARPGLVKKAPAVDLMLGWGHRPSAAVAQRLARQRGLPLWTLEDGFLRSVWLGRDGAPTLSMVVDDEGIFFDARAPSRLERMLIDAPNWRSEALREEAAQVLAALRRHRLSKYNTAPPGDLPQLAEDGRPLVLLLDQAGNDQAIPGACAGPETFLQMLKTAREENPGARLLVKTHPDALAGHRPAHFRLEDLPADTQLLAEAINPWSLLDRVDKVYVVSSLMGFEALMAGLEVHCFGVPFYAGWGLTQDRARGAAAEAALARRGAAAANKLDLLDLIAAAYLRYSRYADPITRKPLTCLQAIERLASWRDTLEQRRGRVLCIGFTRWKWPIMRRALAASPRDVSFVSFEGLAKADVSKIDRLAVWGMPTKPQMAELAAKQRPLIHVEDGFLRSIGLGSDLTRPASLSVDELSLYYDATKPTRMERIILETQFDTALVERAERLRQTILAARLTKYNIADPDLPDIKALAAGRRIILVPGQVPNDASITYGLVSVPDNQALLAGVRAENPEAYIVYKEHPDLISGNRKGRMDPGKAQHCDLYLEKGPILDLMDLADEVQVISSLSGFEALMRKKPVTCWGMPFYAGWGLTLDKVRVERRNRVLTLEELIAAALLLYPTYMDTVTLLPAEPEEAIQRLIERRQQGETSWGTAAPRWIRQIRRLHRYLKAAREF